MISFVPQSPAEYTFLRRHIAEMKGECSRTFGTSEPLPEQILGLLTSSRHANSGRSCYPGEILPDESPWDALNRFLYPQENAAGACYIDVAFRGRDGSLKSLPRAIFDAWNDGTPLLLVKGRGGSGKTTACIRTFVDVVSGHQPFDKQQLIQAPVGAAQRSPRLAGWVNSFDDPLWRSIARRGGQARDRLLYTPATIFFIDLDRARDSSQRREVVQDVCSLAAATGRSRERPAGHVFVMMCRTETLDLRGEPRYFDNGIAQVWEAAHLTDEHGEALAHEYLSRVLGREEADCIMPRLRGQGLVIDSPLYLFLVGNWLRKRNETPHAALACPGRLHESFVQECLSRTPQAEFDFGPSELERDLMLKLSQQVATSMLQRRSFTLPDCDLEYIIRKAAKDQAGVERPYTAGILDIARSGSLVGEEEQSLLKDQASRVVAKEGLMRSGWLRRTGNTCAFVHDTFRDFFVGRAISKSPHFSDLWRGGIDVYSLQSGALTQLERPGEHDAVSAYDALFFAIDLLNPDQVEEITRLLLDHSRFMSPEWSAQTPMIARVLSADRRLRPELRRKLIQRLGHAIELYLQFRKESGADLDLLDWLPSQVIAELVEVWPEFGDSIAQALPRMAGGDCHKAVNVACRVADAYGRCGRPHERSKLYLRLISADIGDHRIVEWAQEKLRAAVWGTSYELGEANEPVRVTRIVGAFLKNCESLDSQFRLVIDNLGHDASALVRTVAEEEAAMAGALSCKLFGWGYLQAGGFRIELLCAALKDTQFASIAVSAMEAPGLMQHICDNQRVSDVARALLCHDRLDEAALCLLADWYLAGQAGAAMEQVGDRLRSLIKKADPLIANVLATPERVGLLISLRSTQDAGRHETAKTFQQIGARSRNDVFAQLQRLEEDVDLGSIPRWLCRRAIMAFGGPEYKAAQEAIFRQTLKGFQAFRGDELKHAFQTLLAYRRTRPRQKVSQELEKHIHCLACDHTADPAVRCLSLALLDNSRILRFAEATEILRAIRPHVSHRHFRQRVRQVIGMLQSKLVPIADVDYPSVVQWTNDLMRQFESVNDNDDLKTCGLAAGLLRSLITTSVLPNQEPSWLTEWVFLSDHKSRDVRKVLFGLLEAHGTKNTADLLERVRCEPRPELDGSVHRFADRCGEVARAIRLRLDRRSGEDNCL